MQFSAPITVQYFDWKEVEEEVSQHGKLKKVVQYLLLDTNLHLWYIVSKGRLYYKTRLVIPKESVKIMLIFLEFGLKT